MLLRRAVVAGDLAAVGGGQRDPAGDSVRAVLGDLDAGLARVAPVPLPGGLPGVDGEPERAGRAVTHGADDLIHPAAARRHERLLAAAEDGGQPVGAEARVLAEPTVVDYRDLLARVGVAPVGHPLGVLGVGEPVLGAGPVAERLPRRPAAAAQGQLGWRWHLLAEVAGQLRHVGREVGAVMYDLDRGR